MRNFRKGKYEILYEKLHLVFESMRCSSSKLLSYVRRFALRMQIRAEDLIFRRTTYSIIIRRLIYYELKSLPQYVDSFLQDLPSQSEPKKFLWTIRKQFGPTSGIFS